MATLATTALLLTLLVATNAWGANPLGLYVGAGGGRADLRVHPVTCSASNCSNATVAGWTAFAGLQPLPFLGAGLVHTEVSALVVHDGIECLIHLCEYVGTHQATRFGWGLGARFKLPELSSLALRAEYVRFSVPSGDPSLLSVALLWKF